MGSKKRRSSSKSAVETPPVGPACEYKNGDDGAWYSVNLVVEDQGETLVVKYTEFSGDPDEFFHAADLNTTHKIHALQTRFRPLSKQLESSDCSMVKKGLTVCALRQFAIDDRRYYDAIVEAVKHKEHTSVNGIDKCGCSFVLSWLEGPEAGTLTSARVEDLCPVQPCVQLDPRLACFLQIAKWKHGITSPCANIFGDDGNHPQQNPLSSSKHTHSYATTQEKSDSAQKIQIASLNDKGDLTFLRNEDVDLDGGGCIISSVKRSCGKRILVDTTEDVTYIDSKRRESGVVQAGKALSEKDEEDGHYSGAIGELVKDLSLQREEGQIRINAVDKNGRYFILVDNLEIDVSPSTIVDFVRDATCVDVEAFVFLALSSEPYTQGALVVESLEELGRLCDFVGRQDQMIISSKGRPWVVPTTSVTEQAVPCFWCLEPGMKEPALHSIGTQLKIVKLGTEEFKKGEKLKEFFLEFSKHQEQLFKSLALEEKKILDSSNCFSCS